MGKSAGWDHTETLDNLMRKGGFRASRITESARLAVTVVRFQSDKIVMSHKVIVHSLHLPFNMSIGVCL